MKMINRRSFIKTAGISTAMMTLSGCLEGRKLFSKAPARKPNFIIIFTDDQGYGDLSCYGSKKIKTPCLDKMASEGIKFTNFYVTASVCTPSRAALMTGCYQTRVGLPTVIFPHYLPAGQKDGKPIGLNPDEITIADVLKQAGYATGCVGKWHLGDLPEFLPNSQGFDEYFGLPYSNDMNPPNRKREYRPLPLIRNNRVIETDPDQTFLTKRYTEEAVKFIRKNKDNPFFLYLAHSMPHRPIYAREQFMKRFNLDEKELNDPRLGYQVRRDKVFPAAIEEIDWGVEQIVKTLKESGIDDNTLIVFTCDNGPSVGSAGPLKGGKGSCYEGGFRVPCIMKWPDKIPAGKVCNEMCSTIDFLPTFAKLAGGKVPTDRVIDGKDIEALMMAQANAKTPHEAFFYLHFNGKPVAVRSGKWKLFLRAHDRWGHRVKAMSLYNLESDIREERNVAAEHPDVVKKLRNMAEKFEKDLRKNARPVGIAEAVK
ncbi:MAG: sulfatase-like hydrolase/transferase [Planctomycetota bacterium]|jgi:arylsulfatase A-like enzyme